MGAYAEHKFEKGFVLNEERLRKINDIVSNRLSLMSQGLTPTFAVFRADSFSYETADLQDIVKEDNSEWRRIQKLVISAEKDTFTFELTLEEKSGASIDIQGDDRDNVFLLFSELKQYISNEVAIAKTLFSGDFRIVFAVLPIIILLIYFLTSNTLTNNRQVSIESVTSSSDINEKLDALATLVIDGNLAPQSSSSLVLLLLVSSILIMITVLGSEGLLNRITKAVFPSNVFLFGKGNERYEKAEKLRGNIFWVVMVGGAISLITGFLLWYATKP